MAYGVWHEIKKLGLLTQAFGIRSMLLAISYTLLSGLVARCGADYTRGRLL
jgi:hypothetical protein